MKLYITILSITLLTQFTFSQDNLSTSWEHEKLWVAENNQSNLIIESEQMYTERWDMLPQATFWKKIMTLTKDSCLINVASSRQILQSIQKIGMHSINWKNRNFENQCELSTK